MVTLTAALYATLVAGVFAGAVPAAAVLQQTRVPFQTQAVCAETGLPHVFSRVTSLKAGRLRCLGQHLEYGAIHSYGTGQGRGVIMRACGIGNNSELSLSRVNHAPISLD